MAICVDFAGITVYVEKYSIFWKCVLCVVRKLRVSKKIMNIILTEILRGKIKIPGVFLRVSI